MTMGDTTNQSKEKGRAPARKGYPDSNAGKKTNLNLVKGVNEIKNTAIPKPLDVDSTRLPIVSTDPTIRPFFFGNPFVENFTGVFHFYEKSATDSAPIPIEDECLMLCMVDVPAFFTCRELIHFVSPMARQISQMKIIRDDCVNKYMALINFKSTRAAHSFYQQFNNIPFNSIEPDKCTLEFDTVDIMTNKLSRSHSATDIPTCSVCLERMDDNVLIILCNHSFHSQCLYKWTDTTCPVCRHTQTPEIVPDQKCFDCGITTDLWMCLICGNVGCGRYSHAHAHQHYEKTSHIFTLQVGGKLVWDYANDNYVHRLIQDSADGSKVVEYDDTIDIDQKESEKMSAIQMDYTCILTSQLENQRLYFEEKLRDAEERSNEYGRSMQQKMNAMESKLQTSEKEGTEIRGQLEQISTAKLQMEKKTQQLQQRNQKLQSELEVEKQMCVLLRKDKETLTLQKEALETLRRQEIAVLEEQVHDLMTHFEAQSKIQDGLKQGTFQEDELKDGSLEIKPSESSSLGKKSTKKRNKK